MRKEWRELLSSRAWWLMLALTGPLVGVSFITAVRVVASACPMFSRDVSAFATSLARM